MSKRKICVVTATRAEYGLLKSLLQAINNNPLLQLQLLVTGTHLNESFGYTLNEIIQDGFFPNKNIEMPFSSDTTKGISNNMGVALIEFSQVFDELKPDIIVVLGDRYELIPIVSAANIASIPVAHLHGGELTEGSKDETFRHAITKLSHLHFAALEEYARRIIQMGEQPERVFNFGSIGLDNLHQVETLDKHHLETELNIQFQKKNLLITYHPDTNQPLQASIDSVNSLIKSLDKLEHTLLIFTKANADLNGSKINKMIEEYALANSNKAVFFDSLGRKRYLSMLKIVDAVVGNSSSGIFETASFKLGTINIGDRQKGRTRGLNVIDVEANETAIDEALEKLYSKEFKNLLRTVINPYGAGDTANKITNILANISLERLINKRFFDIR